MNTRPAYEETLIAHKGNLVRLRPSLRAATQLEAAFGLDNLFRHVSDFRLNTICDLIEISATDTLAAEDLIDALEDLPLAMVKRLLHGPAIEICTGLVPHAPDIEADEDTRTDTPGKATPWADTYKELFSFSTGWLHWTPEAAWAATPTEIVTAITAHLDHLKALHGAPDEDSNTNPEQRAENEAAGLDPDFDRSGLMALKARLA